MISENMITENKGKSQDDMEAHSFTLTIKLILSLFMTQTEMFNTRHIPIAMT